jgi:ribonucleoside-diphosphate reductase alpha chain
MAKESHSIAAGRERLRLVLNENQFKVIKDKYLQDAPDVETWLRGVAHNIALSELLFAAESGRWDLFEGVSVKVAQASSAEGAPAAKFLLFQDGLTDLERREANSRALLRNLERACERHPEAKRLVDAWSSRFYEMMASWDFLPNSPTLVNAGRELQQLSACYVLPVQDSIEGVARAMEAQSIIQKSGGGTGFSFSRLRPKGDAVKKTHGVASGVVSFMQLFDKMTEVIKQGGVRRGANMGVLHYTHPEIREFIALKTQPGLMSNFNLSVAIDEAFMKAVDDDLDIELRNPRNGESAGRAKARDLFELMVDCAWKTGDPGLIVLDRINASASNPTPGLGAIEAVNPCGEQPLLPWEPCNLGSLNLSRFVSGPVGRGAFDFERLAAAVRLATRFLDDVIEVNNYPLPQIERLAKGNRRIGLGVMGYAEALVKMGISYDSDEALRFAERLMGFVQEEALAASEELARERGVFPNWGGSIYDPQSPHFRGEARAPRHAALTTIAPTGTIALAAGLQGSGIEPFFSIAYTRYNARALDALKRGQTPSSADTLIEANSLFKEMAAERGYFGLSERELWAKVNANKGRVRGLSFVPEELQKLFATSHDVSPEFHVKTQAAFQKHVDNGVSKTVNLANAATREEVRRVFLMSYRLGLKGITVYRDGSKAQQVLSLPSSPSRMKRSEPTQAHGASSAYYQVQTGYGPLHVHINYDERGPYQVFANIPPLGTEISALTSVVGILLSKYLAQGGDPIRILKHLNSVKGDRPLGMGEKRIDSIAHAISVALREHLEKTGWFVKKNGPVEGGDALLQGVPREYCPSCYSPRVAHVSGCGGITCLDCGYSECS